MVAHDVRQYLFRYIDSCPALEPLEHAARGVENQFDGAARDWRVSFSVVRARAPANHLERTRAWSFGETTRNDQRVVCRRAQQRRGAVEGDRHVAEAEHVLVVAPVDCRPGLHEVLLQRRIASESAVGAQAHSKDSRGNLFENLPDGRIPWCRRVGDQDNRLRAGAPPESLGDEGQGLLGLAGGFTSWILVECRLQQERFSMPATHQELPPEG